MRGIQQRAELGLLARAQRGDGGGDTLVFAADVLRAGTQWLGQALDLLRRGLAQRRHPEQLAGPPALGAAQVVAGARVRVSLAGVDDREPPATERERHLLDAQRMKIDQHGLLGRAVERGELIEQPGLRPGPFALHASAQSRERGSVELLGGLAAVLGCERDERQRQRHLERRRGGEARTSR